jgi:hypothetical protein
LSLIVQLPFGHIFTALIASLSTSFRSRAALQLEFLALRHQIGVLQLAIGSDGPNNPYLNSISQPVQRRVALPDQLPHQFAHRNVQQRVALRLNSTKNQQLRPVRAKRTASGAKGRKFESYWA